MSKICVLFIYVSNIHVFMCNKWEKITVVELKISTIFTKYQ